jgi:hypothetical protein
VDSVNSRSHDHLGIVLGCDVYRRRTLGLWHSKQKPNFLPHLPDRRIISLFLFAAWWLLRNAGPYHCDSGPYTNSYTDGQSFTESFA